VIECDQPLEPSTRFSLAAVDAVTLGRGDRGATLEEDPTRRHLLVRIPDPRVSSLHARVLRSMEGWVLEDAGSKNGTLVNGTTQARAVLSDGDLLELGGTFFLYRDGDEPSETLDATRLAAPAEGMKTFVRELEHSFDAMAKIARSEVAILIQGESGTGKELAARALHQLSGRTGTFVAVNCGALPANLVESELFGHKKGAFSGAVADRRGLVQTADGGTLFLDEIGDLPPAAQAALLRVLQEREVLPIGATQPVPLDLRVVSATHRDLDAKAAAGEFRVDLLARLSGFGLQLPPLRKRREDLGILIGALLQRIAGDRAGEVKLSGDAMRALMLYGWPLNVRELEHCLKSAVVLAGDGRVEVHHLPITVRHAPKPATPRSESPAARNRREGSWTEEDARRREELVQLLREHKGNVSAIAKAMGKARMQVQRWLQRYQLDAETYRR
jgi:transcriptional regulator with GAF, ATPase, and Fis domain